MIHKRLHETAHVISARQTYKGNRYKHYSLGKNDRHHIGSIHLQRNVLTCATILLITHNFLRILYRDLSCALNKQNCSCNNQQQNYNFNQEHNQTTCLVSHTRNQFLEQRLRQTRNNTDHNNQ